MKSCTHCQKVKLITDFHKHCDSSDGHRSYCKNCARIKRVEYHHKNKNHTNRTKKEWMTNHPEKISMYGKTSYKNNKDKFKLRSKHRKMIKIERVPRWANITKINKIYKERDQLNEIVGFVKYNVDHVIPLRGKNVSGLHVETNLEIITAYLNDKKGNKYG